MIVKDGQGSQGVQYPGWLYPGRRPAGPATDRTTVIHLRGETFSRAEVSALLRRLDDEANRPIPPW